MTVDLCLHEIGHGIGFALQGASACVIRTTEDGAECGGLIVEDCESDWVVGNAATLIAGAAFTVALDSRFAKVPAADKLQFGIGVMAVCNTLGLCLDDAERLKEHDTAEAHRAARFYTLLAFEREDVWRALAEIVHKRLERDGHFSMRADKLRSYLSDADVLHDMAALPEWTFHDAGQRAHMLHSVR